MGAEYHPRRGVWKIPLLFPHQALPHSTFSLPSQRVAQVWAGGPSHPYLEPKFAMLRPLSTSNALKCGVPGPTFTSTFWSRRKWGAFPKREAKKHMKTEFNSLTAFLSADGSSQWTLGGHFVFSDGLAQWRATAVEWSLTMGQVLFLDIHTHHLTQNSHKPTRCAVTPF